MWEPRVDEPVSLHPKRRRGVGWMAWLIRGVFISAHLAMACVALSWIAAEKRSTGSVKATVSPRPTASPKPVAPIRKPTVAPSSTPPSPKVEPPKVEPPKVSATARPSAIPASEATPRSLAAIRGESTPQVVRQPPEAILREIGLERSARCFRLGGEADAARQFAQARSTFQNLRFLEAQMMEIAQNDAMIAQRRQERIIANDRVAALRIVLDGTPSRGNSIIIANHQAIHGEWLGARDTLRVISSDLSMRVEQSPKPAERQSLKRNREQLESTFRDEVYELRRIVDATSARYQELSRQASVKDAIDRLVAAGEKVKLGPSDQFLAIQRELTGTERQVARARGTARPKGRQG